MRMAAICAVFIALTTTVDAQWLDRPTTGLPRGTDGQPNLTAPTPRSADAKPDLSGLWTGPEIVPSSTPSHLQPWVNEATSRHAQNFYKDRPMYRCLPSGPATFSQSTGGGVWKQIVQTPNLLVILNDDLTYRRIFMDGRTLEANPIPSWMGYSIGRWEGDTLVVESFGFNDKTWLNGRGLQHTEALRMTERYTRPDVGHLKIDVSFADRGAYHEPLSMTVNMALAADTEMLERVCETGNDTWTGTVSDVERGAVSVSAEILKQYVGVYTGFWGTRPRKVEVALANGQLVVHLDDSPRQLPLTPRSERLFQIAEDGGLAYEFVTFGNDRATDVVEIHVSGGYKYARQR